MHLLDIAPTLLDLAGFETPESMQGCSLLARSRSEVGCGQARDSLGKRAIRGFLGLAGLELAGLAEVPLEYQPDVPYASRQSILKFLAHTDNPNRID